MKKILVIILALVMMFAFAGCGNKDDIEQTNSNLYFDAKILEVSEDNILVEPFAGNEMPSNPATVSTFMYEDDQLPLKVGMQVRIMLGGQAKERTVLAIYLLDDIENTK